MRKHLDRFVMGLMVVWLAVVGAILMHSVVIPAWSEWVVAYSVVHNLGDVAVTFLFFSPVVVPCSLVLAYMIGYAIRG